MPAMALKPQCYRNCYRRRSFRAPGASESLVDLHRRIFLHGGGHMRVEVKRGADGRVPEAFLGDLRVNAGEQELGRVAMPEIMEPDARHALHAADKPGELMRQAAGLMRLAVGAGARQRLTCLPDAEDEQLLGLLALQAAQILDSEA